MPLVGDVLGLALALGGGKFVELLFGHRIIHLARLNHPGFQRFFDLGANPGLHSPPRWECVRFAKLAVIPYNQANARWTRVHRTGVLFALRASWSRGSCRRPELACPTARPLLHGRAALHRVERCSYRRPDDVGLSDRRSRRCDARHISRYYFSCYYWKTKRAVADQDRSMSVAKAPVIERLILAFQEYCPACRQICRPNCSRARLPVISNPVKPCFLLAIPAMAVICSTKDSLRLL